MEFYNDFDATPTTSRVAAQMQAAKEARRRRWAGDGSSAGSSECGSSNMAKKY